MQTASFPRSKAMRYGLLGVPLAFAGLPIYVHIPAFYAVTLHVDLALLGATLLSLRLMDAVIDPFIGSLSDRFCAHRKRIMAICLPFLAASYILLFSPSGWAISHALIWLILCLILVYLSFSTLMINYYAMGIELAQSPGDNTRLSAWREGLMLTGVLLASLIPSLLMRHYDVKDAYRWFSMMLLPLLLACGYATLSVAPHTSAHVNTAGPSFFRLLKSTPVRWILIVALFNFIPNAITSTLFLFFADDVLKAGQQSGLMLAVYFVSAAAAMPLWAKASGSFGKRKSLLAAMVMAIACFIWVWRLGAGDIVPFYAICLLSGMAMGADAALLPALFADTLGEMREASATGFGLWNLTSKLTMALAAGIALPVLALKGYHAGASNTADALGWLSVSYGLLPCTFKAVAVLLLFISPLDSRRLS